MLPAESRACHVPTLRQLQQSRVGSAQSVDPGLESQGGSMPPESQSKQRTWSKHPGRKHRVWHPLPSSLNSSASPNGLAGLRSHTWRARLEVDTSCRGSKSESKLPTLGAGLGQPVANQKTFVRVGSARESQQEVGSSPPHLPKA